VRKVIDNEVSDDISYKNNKDIDAKNNPPWQIRKIIEPFSKDAIL
jgi:hypothetical protein